MYPVATTYFWGVWQVTNFGIKDSGDLSLGITHHMEKEQGFMMKIHHDKKSLSALLVLCEGNPQVKKGFASRKISNADFLCISFAEKAIEWTMEILLI